MDGGPLKHDRDFSALRERYGIKDPDWASAVELDPQVRMGVQLEDLSALVRPLSGPSGVWQLDVAAVGGSHGGGQVTILAKNGAWVQFSSDGAIEVCHQTLSAPWTHIAFALPEVIPGDQGAPESTVATGRTVTPPAGCDVAPFYAPGAWQPNWFPMGTVLQALEQTVNTIAVVNIKITEIP